MSYRYPTYLLAIVFMVFSAADAQTVEHSPAELAKALLHRRDEVREKAFAALLEKAQSSEDISAAKEELRRFANMQHVEMFKPDQLLDYQADALKILVITDDDVAEKVLSRVSRLVKAYIALKPQDSSTAFQVNLILKRAYSVLMSLQDPSQIRQAADLAEQVSPQLIQYDFEVLLPLVYRKYTTGSERVEATERLMQHIFESRNEWNSRVEGCVFAGIYSAKVDEKTIAFLTRLPANDNVKAKFRANMLGLLSKRSEEAMRAAIRIMEDTFEEQSLRNAAASGLMAVHTPDEEEYWQADAVLQPNNGYYSEVFEFAPRFSESERDEIHKKRFEKKEAVTTPMPLSDKKPVLAPVSTDVAASKEDMKEFQKVMIASIREIRKTSEKGKPMLLIPRNTYDRVQQAHRMAVNSGHSKVAELYRKTLEQWNEIMLAGRARLVD